MANELTHALTQTNGGNVASILSPLLAQQLYDPTDLRAVCVYRPFLGGMGSDTMDVTKDVVPSASAAASSETSGGHSNTAYTTARYQLAVARRVINYEMSDLLGLTGGPINLPHVAAKLAAGIGLTFTDMICALFPSLSNSVGSTGVDMDVDDWYDAMFQLNTSLVPSSPDAPWVAVLHQQQVNNLVSSIRSEAGAAQFISATADMLRAKGPGFVGQWLGVDLWQSDSVNAVATSADRNGAMFGYGCFEYTYGPVGSILQHINPGDVLAATPEAFIERERDHVNGLVAAHLNHYPGVVEREDLRGVGIITDL